MMFLLCISCKVKKSESKSQQANNKLETLKSCVYPVKLKNLKANHNLICQFTSRYDVVYIL